MINLFRQLIYFLASIGLLNLRRSVYFSFPSSQGCGKYHTLLVLSFLRLGLVLDTRVSSAHMWSAFVNFLCIFRKIVDSFILGWVSPRFGYLRLMLSFRSSMSALVFVHFLVLYSVRIFNISICLFVSCNLKLSLAEYAFFNFF